MPEPVTPIPAARETARAWADTPVPQRAGRLRSLRLAAVERLDRIVEAVRRDTGKVRTEALLTDVLPTLEQMLYNERHAARTLSAERRPGSALFRGARARVEHVPWGVVLVVSPWNNPFQLALLPAATALIAGNAVVIKPSERAPATAAILRELLDAADLGAPLATVSEGGADAVRPLLEAGPDLLFFTGGTPAGRAVCAAAAERLIPAILELGAKDPMIVFEDADLERAADAAVYGAFAHDGRHCVSVARLLVHEPVAEPLARAVAAGASRLVRGRDLAESVDPAAASRLQGLIADALARGARLLTPRIDGLPALPAVLDRVRPEMAVAREETFGPVLPVLAFRDEREAVALACGTDLGLVASIWTRDPARVRRLTARLRTGGVCVNNVLVSAGHPALPFGGVRQSGFGRYHGPEGLRAFVRPCAVMEQAEAGPREVNWFPYGEDADGLVEELVRLRYGPDGVGPAGWWRWLRLEGRRRARLKRKGTP